MADDARTRRITRSSARLIRCGQWGVVSATNAEPRRADGSHGRVFVANPDEDCFPAAIRVLIDEFLIAPEPEIESLDAAAVLAAIRADSQHE